VRLVRKGEVASGGGSRAGGAAMGSRRPGLVEEAAGVVVGMKKESSGSVVGRKFACLCIFRKP
jgi:hypothetical protein